MKVWKLTGNSTWVEEYQVGDWELTIEVPSSFFAVIFESLSLLSSVASLAFCEDGLTLSVPLSMASLPVGIESLVLLESIVHWSSIYFTYVRCVARFLSTKGFFFVVFLLEVFVLGTEQRKVYLVIEVNQRLHRRLLIIGDGKWHKKY